MEDRNTNKKINYSIEFLRFLLCFWVVLHHCCRNVGSYKGRFHVPTFMILSFYFYYNSLNSKIINKIEQRFQRILIPYIIWPIFTFIFNIILVRIFDFTEFQRKLKLKDLVHQLIFGFKFQVVFYYQFNLIFLTIIFTIISILLNNNFIIIFQIFLIFAYFFQYNGLNKYFFSQYSPVIKIPLGSFLELLPFAVAGTTLHYLDVIKRLKRIRKLSIIFLEAIIFFILKFDVFVKIEGFFFPGIFLNIGGICLFILFSLFSFQNKKLVLFLKFITKFTGGIYYVHKACYFVLKKELLFVKKHTFHGSLLIYLTSYIICYFGNKYTYKTKLKFLFN